MMVKNGIHRMTVCFVKLSICNIVIFYGIVWYFMVLSNIGTGWRDTGAEPTENLNKCRRRHTGYLLDR